MPDKLGPGSMDTVAERVGQLRQVMPEVFSETGIDWEQLRRVLGEWVDPGKERFGLNWPGKADCIRVIQQPSIGTLLPMREESVNFDDTQNVIIEGDNLEVLKLLQKSYFGKVKMIYIDPPYNTGNEFIYPDNFKEGLQDYLRYSGQTDEEGMKLSANLETDGRYHSKWLNMMYPRLFLARNLLRDDGVIFISIDDNEHPNLRLLLDEIFGPENFIANIVWKHTQQSKNDERYFSRHHNSVLCYRRSELLGPFRFERTQEDDRAYSNPDNDPKGYWRSGDVRSPNLRPSLRYEVTTPSGKSIEPPENGWRWSKETLQSKIDSGEIKFSQAEDRIIRKIYLSEQEGRTPENVWANGEAGTTRSANAELKELFGDRPPFDTPKPTELIRRLMQLAATKEDDLILDFFAGSGTTGHAVSAQSADDGLSRRFLLIQLPEQHEDPTYGTIAEVTRERVRRVVEKIALSKPEVVSNFGFQSYKLTSSNFRSWNGENEPENLQTQLMQLADNTVEGRSEEDILTELLLKAGFELTVPVEKMELAGKTIFSVGEGALLLSLDEYITLDAVEQMVQRDPQMIICLDEGFRGDDELKVNAVQTVNARNRNTESSIVFKVV
jgi:adenine-specific DNA-methyltransferase